MNHELNALQHRFLKQLLMAGGSAPLKDLKPALKPESRNPLVESQLVAEEKQGRVTSYMLTEAGRTWITEHPDAPATRRTKTANDGTHPFPNAHHRLSLLRLLFVGGTAVSNELKPAISVADRNTLVAEKLLEIQRGPKRLQTFTLTDAGWKWAEDHLADPISASGKAAAALSQQLLTKVHAYIRNGDIRLADVVRAKIVPPTLPDVFEPQPVAYHSENGDIEKAIEEACLRLGGGEKASASAWRI